MPRWLTPLLVTALAPLAAAGDDPPAAGRPTCALLDPTNDPRAALLEAKALPAADATWVERAGIDRVLAEQKLQALFGPQGIGDRVRLGKLLKADLLVMVRPAAGVGEPALELVVSETAGGLRLLVRGVPVTKDADADAAALLAAARDGIKKYRERVREVVAVPPFLSRDLAFDTDHLKGAYAKLTEQAALARPGVVAVELAEAEALARELALAGPGAKLDRPAPLYLLGEFRHEGKGKERTVALTLRAERAGAPVAPPLVRAGRRRSASSFARTTSAGSGTRPKHWPWPRPRCCSTRTCRTCTPPPSRLSPRWSGTLTGKRPSGGRARSTGSSGSTPAASLTWNR
ncbi:hypothetical protein J0H58_22190 [bacterium]|nr:hypothetical protein [bacterium]